MAHGSYYPNYFSIEDIMITQEKVPVKTAAVYKGLGFLSPDNEEEDLPRDVSLNIPIWLAEKLLKEKMTLIRVELPNAFRERARDVFEADPTVVNLFRVNPNFYEYGLCFLRLEHRDVAIIKQLLGLVFRKRFQFLIEWAVNGMNDPNKIQQLCLSEQKMLKAGIHKSELMHEWFIHGVFKLKPADMVVSLKKRKLLESK